MIAVVAVIANVLIVRVMIVMNEDEQFLIQTQKIADAFGDDNEIDLGSNLFWKLLAINCSKDAFY